MKKQGKQSGRLLRGAALALTVVLAVALIPALGMTNAAAVESLEHIEYIKNHQTTFTVLELVPELGKGSLGYYAEGQEPTAGSLSVAAAKTDRTQRLTYLNGMLTDLTNRGLLGSGNAAPLAKVSDFQEFYPWENRPSTAAALELNAAEEVSVHAVVTNVGVNKGSYKLPGTALFDKGAGSHVQNIRYFVSGQSTEGTVYYYNPQFTVIDQTDFAGIDALVDARAAVYVAKNAAGQTLNPYDMEGEGAQTPARYEYEGTLGLGGYTLDITMVDVPDRTDPAKTVSTYDRAYFYVEAAPEDMEPFEAYHAATAPYYAVADSDTPFLEVGAGQGDFTIDRTKYTYVGENQGDYNLVASPSGTSCTISCKTVYVTGGYTNNNWLLRYVFDVSDPTKSTLKVKVDSVTPQTLGSKLSSANLIVISAGFDPATGSTKPYSSDITAEQAAAIRETLSGASKTPVLVDAGISANAAPVLKALVNELKASGAMAAPFVQNNLYCFAADTARAALATKAFITAFDASLSDGTGDPYTEVLDKISYENSLRTKEGKDLLTASVTMASCLRHIINYSGQRVQNRKSALNVLEIQPQTQTKTNGVEVTPAYIYSNWIPSDAKTVLKQDKITVTTMSSAEFISKIEDINETYDLVYIGASRTNVPSAYNDSDHMAGLLYSNVGDTVQGRLLLSGLLDSDYVSSTKIKNNWQTYRYSGNDITGTKAKELRDFVASGFPVVIADDLLASGTPGTPAYELAVEVNGSVSGNTVTLTANVDTEATGSFTYQWYRQGSVNALRTNTSTAKTNSYSFSAAAGTYYCLVTYEAGTDQKTEATSNTVTLSSGGLNIPDTGIGGQPGTFPKPITSNTSIGISGYYQGNRYYYSVTVPSNLGTVDSYQWYRKNGSSWTARNNSNSKSHSSDKWDYDGVYYCRITMKDGTVYCSRSITPDWGDYEKEIITTTVDVPVSVTVTKSGNTLTASLTPEIPGVYLYYFWYLGYEALPVGRSVAITAPGSYTCWVYYLGKPVASSPTFTVTSGVSVTKNVGGTAGTIPAVAGSTATVNGNRVDNSSVLHEALTDALDSANVMSSSQATSQKETLIKYLNLSKPAIEEETFVHPAEYSGNFNTSTFSGSELSYTFRILNETDSTPESTRYTCNLYLDQNGDGRYDGDEMLSDLTITYVNETGQTRETSYRDLKAGVLYTVKRTLPQKVQGIIPWRLEIVKNGYQYIHTSESGYTYKKPTSPIPLKILQITSYSGGGGSRYFLGNQKAYTDLFAQLSSLYSITITGKSVSELNAFSPSNFGGAATAAEYLNGFNMLIIGFGDGYGYGESYSGFTLDVSMAIRDYIKSGRAVLFTHDTTSYSNLPSEDFSNGTWTSTYDGQWYWGYHFNTVIRDAVGLDRYGVTNPKYGISKYSSLKTELSETGTSAYNWVANGYLLTPGQTLDSVAGILTDADYSVAYEPKSGRTKTVNETQGYTALTLKRYGSGGSGSGTTTTSVSRVNTGQVTTFPYPLGSTINVQSTHEQYYQLNMNSEDIVVWYCLSGGTYSSTYKNDGTNAYYIYNRGNVTYSGAGHVGGSVTTEEAKLFVNTMIAAYRAGKEQPTVQFKTVDDQTIETVFLPLETDNSGNTSLIQDSQSLYFTVSDPNLSAEKTVGVKFYYETTAAGSAADEDLKAEDGAAPVVKEFAADIYLGAGGSGKVTGSLSNRTLYRIDLPSDLIRSFAASTRAEQVVYVKVITTIGGGEQKGFDRLTLKKMPMLSLR